LSVGSEDGRSRIGLLIVGLSGNNGVAISRALEHLSAVNEDVDYGISSLKIFDPKHFPNANQIVLAGWDVRGVNSVLLRPGLVTQGLWGATDTSLGDETSGVGWESISTAASHIAGQIREFKEALAVNQVIVMSMSSPPRRLNRPIAEWTEPEVLSATPNQLPSAFAYALGAIQAKASFIDFTPSETLEWSPLWNMARDTGTQLAGRDGSTGQTFLKSLVASALEMRGLHVASWYSTNILGNRDGAVLMLPGVDATKQADKAHAVESITGMRKGEHLIDIRYVAELGDYKESWDSVVARDFLGNSVELRINWKAEDSPLAAQLALDLVRMLASGAGYHRGRRDDLAIFFKHPIGGVTPRSPMQHLNELISSNEFLLRPDTTRADLTW
jgi:myo-inositol-1-phosphate synthase